MRITSCLWAIVLMVVFLPPNGAVAGEEPKGLTLRKGQVRWRASLKDARQFIEEEFGVDRTPKRILKGPGDEDEKPRIDTFRCEKEKNTSVVICELACCVDLGGNNVSDFATLWFHKDRFYAHQMTFNTGYFTTLAASLEKRFGKPTKEGQQTVVNRNPLAWRYGTGSFIVQTMEWVMDTTRVVLSDRGGEGKIGVGALDVIYLPVWTERDAERRKKQPDADLPF